MPSKPKTPDAGAYFVLIDAGHNAETALRKAGYRVKTPNAVRAMASKLNARRAPAQNAPLAPAAVAALDPIRRAIWDALAPEWQEWLTVSPSLTLAEELSTPWLLENQMFLAGRPQTCPTKPWDATSRAQAAEGAKNA